MYTNYPFGVCLAHNGNLTNIKELRESVFAEGRHINTDSVSQLSPLAFGTACTHAFADKLLGISAGSVLQW